MAFEHHRAALERGLPIASAPIRAWVDELWRDWLRESDDPDQEEILQVLAEDWAERTVGLDADGRVDTLHRDVVERRVRALVRDSLALGEAALGLGEGLSSEQVQEHARTCLMRVQPLANGIQALEDHPILPLLQRDLQIASLDLVYAAEGGAMSPRLARIAEAAGRSP